jgi:type IV pilus assembly protein PilC
MNLRSEIRQASIYPSILLVLACGVVIGIATIVLPRFVNALSRAGIPPTESAARVIAAGQFVQTYWLQIVLGLVILAAATALAAENARGHYWLDYVKLRLPLFGTLMRQAALSRFAHHLSMMVRAGVNFVVALNVVEHVVGNRVIAASIASARERVIGGSSLADALRVSGQFTPFVLQMVATGEATGSIEDTLKKVSEYYDREVPATVKRITTAMEPLVYVILGVVVIAVALALYSPLASLMRQIPTRPRGF